MLERFFLVIWGCGMLISLYRVVTGRDREDQDYRRAYRIAMEHYIAGRFGRVEPPGPWIAATVIILVLFSLFLLWVGSFG